MSGARPPALPKGATRRPGLSLGRGTPTLRRGRRRTCVSHLPVGAPARARRHRGPVARAWLISAREASMSWLSAAASAASHIIRHSGTSTARSVRSRSTRTRRQFSNDSAAACRSRARWAAAIRHTISSSNREASCQSRATSPGSTSGQRGQHGREAGMHGGGFPGKKSASDGIAEQRVGQRHTLGRAGSQQAAIRQPSEPAQLLLGRQPCGLLKQHPEPVAVRRPPGLEPRATAHPRAGRAGGRAGRPAAAEPRRQGRLPAGRCTAEVPVPAPGCGRRRPQTVRCRRLAAADWPFPPG